MFKVNRKDTRTTSCSAVLTANLVFLLLTQNKSLLAGLLHSHFYESITWKPNKTLHLDVWKTLLGAYALIKRISEWSMKLTETYAWSTAILLE